MTFQMEYPILNLQKERVSECKPLKDTHTFPNLSSTAENSKPVIQILNTLRPRQNGRHFPNDTFKWIFLNENLRIVIKISLKLIPKVPINTIPALILMIILNPYLNQRWLIYWRIYASLCLSELKIKI